MKMGISFMKLSIRLLIFMIFCIVIYLITAVFYSSQYWPDIYRYIHPNITIKHIPTLTELNLIALEVDYTTEVNTIEPDYDSSTIESIDIDIDEFTYIQADIKTPKHTKRHAEIETFENDYNELPTKSVVVDYMFEDTYDKYGVVWKKIVKDLIDESKLVPKNLGEIEIVNRKNGAKLQKLTNICHGNSSDVTAIFPWIATIFIKNETANQYQYICDGAIINERLLITAARCVNFYNTTVKPDDVLVFLGKRSLQTVGDNEMNVRIARIIIHEGFLIDGEVANDLALLVMEERVVFTDGIRPACLDVEGTGKSVKTSTTAWDPKGDLTPVFFEDGSDCSEIGYSSFCATYGNEVALCPSYGGIFAAKRASRWYLHAVRSGDVADRGLCFTKNVWYTPLAQYMDWIREFME